MRTTRRAVIALLVVMAACSAPHAAAPDLTGTAVDVVAVWRDDEAANFSLVLRAFERQTGARVRYESTEGQDIAAVLARRIAAGRPPDVAILPQPALLDEYARDGAAQPLPPAVAAEVRARYGRAWQRLATIDGRLYGVWFKAAHKSLVWYSIAAFERAGVVPPHDFDGLVDGATRLRAAGFVPWAVAGAPEDAWTLTDWFENLYLRSAGPARYDALARHRLAWTHPSVVAALERMRRTFAPAFTAAPPVVARTTFPASVAQLFALHPRVAMLLEGDFVPGVAGPAPAQLGVDVDVFVFPGPGPGATDRYIVGGGDVATLMRPPSRAAAELMRFLASPRAAEVWARRGGFVSPNEQVALDAYPDGVTRTIARSLLDAGDGFHFDLSDLQPVAFGGTTGAGMWSLLRDFIAGKSGARQTAAQLEAAADAAYRP